MSNEKMREEFEAAYVEEMVRRLSEGFRSSALYSMSAKKPDGDYLHPTASQAWWAWQASRAAIEVGLPKRDMDLSDFALGFNACLSKGARSIQSLGLKVKS